MAEKVERPVEDTEVPAAEQMMQELAIFGPEPEEFDTSIGKVNIRPMKMGQLSKMISIAKDLFPVFMGLVDQFKTTGEISVSALGEIAGDRFFEIIGLAINRKAVELEELDPDEFVQIVAKVIVVNMDFFGRRLPEILAQAHASVQREANRTGVGRMLSKNSSVTATDSKT